MLFIGIDDTDTLDTRGTGYLARQIAVQLSDSFSVLGVVRHQLLRDPRVPCTKNNSSAAILLDGDGTQDPVAVLERVQALLLAHFVPGSDPGLCVASKVAPAIMDFGRKAQAQLVGQAEARELAARHGVPLVGLGGSEDGVIGALAAVGLAAGGHDGRYVQVGRVRELTGLQPVEALLAAGIASVQTASGQPVASGLVQTERLRPARRNSCAVAVVEWAADHWQPLKLD